MKVVGLIGSPRVRGNTEVLVAEVLRGAASVGADVEQISLNRLDISPCQACESCRKTGRCRIKDDMQPLYDTLLDADGIVLGTPIYFWGPSAQMKAFLDRWYALDQDGIRERLAGKRLRLVCAFADSDPTTPDAAIIIVRRGAEWFGMPFADPLLAVADKRGEVAGNAEIMQKAYQMGINLGG